MNLGLTFSQVIPSLRFVMSFRAFALLCHSETSLYHVIPNGVRNLGGLAMFEIPRYRSE